MILGSADISAVSYNRAAAQAFLPGRLNAWHPMGLWNFSVESPSHPVFAIFRKLENFGAFSLFENLVDVIRFWKVVPSEGAQVLTRYTDSRRSPALLERNFGKGRTIMLTTAADLPDNPNDRWNTLPSPVVDAWLFLAFVEQLTDHAARWGEESFQFFSGQSITLRLPPSRNQNSNSRDSSFLQENRNWASPVS